MLPMRKLSILLVFASGCASAPLIPERSPDALAPPLPADFERVDAARLRIRARLASQAEQLWTRWTAAPAAGEVDSQNVPGSSAMTRMPGDEDVASLPSIRKVRHATDDPDERRALEFLEAHVASEILAGELAELDEASRLLESTGTFEALGARHAFHHLGQLLADERDPARRRALAAGSAAVAEELDRMAVVRDAKAEAVARRLGYAGAAALGASLAHVDPEALARLADAFLSATEPTFRLAFAEAARRELGLPLHELRRSDLPRLFRGLTFDARFPGDGSRAALESTLDRLGIDRQAIRVDDEPRESKLPHPACFPIHPPDDIRLSLPSPSPEGDWRPLFREFGCALHAAHVEVDRFEFRQLGHQASADGLAQLIEGLPESAAWLRAHTRLTWREIDAQLAGAALEDLFLARRRAARILFDRQRDAGPDEAAEVEEAYGAAMERAFLFPIGAEVGSRWLLERDGRYSSASAFTSTLLAAALEAGLEAAYGEAWWERREAADDLRRLWSSGNRASPDELARVAGADGLSIQPLVEKLSARLAPLLVPPPLPPPEPAPEPAADEKPPPPAVAGRPARGPEGTRGRVSSAPGFASR